MMPSPYLHSSLADDPDLCQIVRCYIDEMPQRIEGLLARFAAADWDGLATAAHQLKGTAGSHGFPQITLPAAELEKAARQKRSASEVRSALDVLVEYCSRVRHA
ncbi:MAG TPA: Hpt domain-containing protein [Pirellulales bacterium]|nr:Hpt domain-containing protein [Pirellulales bacterium]